MTSRPTGYCLSSMRPYTSKGKYIFSVAIPGFLTLCVLKFLNVLATSKGQDNFFLQNEKVLELDGGDFCATTRVDTEL